MVIAVTIPEKGTSYDEFKERVKDEAEGLQLLASKGLPTVKFFGETEVSGQPALILEYIDGASSKDITDNSKNPIAKQNAIELLNESSIRDLEAIRDSLIRQNLNVTDLQFMIRKDGRVFINDPMGVQPGSPYSEDIDRINDMINHAKSRISGEKLHVPSDVRKYFDLEKSSWHED